MGSISCSLCRLGFVRCLRQVRRDNTDELLDRYAQSLSALSHLILLVPQNPFYLLRHAETAYTLGDIPLAYKEMLRVVEMSDGVEGVGGPALRAAIGVKLVRLVISFALDDYLTEMIPE